MDQSQQVERLSLELVWSDLDFGWYFQSRDIYNNMQFYAIHRIATPQFDCLVKSKSSCEGCKKSSLGIDHNFQKQKKEKEISCLEFPETYFGLYFLPDQIYFSWGGG